MFEFKVEAKITNKQIAFRIAIERDHWPKLEIRGDASIDSDLLMNCDVFLIGSIIFHIHV